MTLPVEGARRLLARRYLGHRAWSDAVEWAVRELEAGRDSESLRILAGLTTPEGWSEVDDWLPRAFRELGYEWPDRETCLRAYARDVAARMVDRDMTADAGCAELYQVHRALDLAHASVWDYLADNLHPHEGRELGDGEFDEVVIEFARKLLETGR